MGWVKICQVIVCKKIDARSDGMASDVHVYSYSATKQCELLLQTST